MSGDALTLDIFKNSEFAGDGNAEIVVDDANQLCDEFPFVLKERPEMTSSGNHLGAAKIKINGVTVDHLHCKFHRLPKNIRIVGAKLHNQRSILRTGFHCFDAVFLVSNEHARVPHGRVAELGAVAPRQHAPGQLAGVYHRCHDVPTFL